jgi:Cellulase (glycosyl hydrolase family 5)
MPTRRSTLLLPLLGLPGYLGPTRPALAAAPARLAVRGADIVDPAGQPIILRGWNWGHWARIQTQDAAENAAQGANVVRIPLRWWGNYPGKDVDSRDDAATATAGIAPGNLKRLDEIIHAASNARLWIVLFLDSDCGQGGTLDPAQQRYCDPRGEYGSDGHNFWTDAPARQKFIAAWRFVANRYKDTPYLGMFEPLPEPNPHGATPAQIKAFYAEVMAAIREVAPGVPLLVGGRSYKATAVAEVVDPAWKDVVYTGNLFLHARTRGADDASLGEYRERVKRLLDLRAQRQVPVFVQQVGVRSSEDPDRRAVREMLQQLAANRIGFTYWDYRGAGNPDEYSVLYQRGQDWVVKREWVDAITPFFRQR